MNRWRTAGVVLAVIAVAAALARPAPVATASAANPQFDEWDSLNLINRERRAAGLRPVAMAPPARDVARAWSKEMAGANYLSHNSNFSNLLRPLFPDYRKFGENVGVGASVTGLHTAFMGSAGHRANILGDYNYVGVGVHWVPNKLWVTVNFVNSATPQPFVTRTPLTRVGGASDPDTAVLLSRRLGPGAARAVVVARADDFADALAGGPLAAVNGGPLLLTPPTDAPANVVEEAKRVVATGGTIFILGGPNAISPAVELEFANAGLRTARLAGADRFGTATAVAMQVNPQPAEAFIVSGVSFPDAIVAGAPAGARRSPILLVAPTSVPAATNVYLAARPTMRRVVIGGPAAVSETAATSIAATERVAGADRYATSVAVAQKYFPNGNRLALAPGFRYQDALTASPEAGRDGYPVLLTASPPSDPTYDHIGRQANRWVFALAVGRPSDLTDDTVITLFS